MRIPEKLPINLVLILLLLVGGIGSAEADTGIILPESAPSYDINYLDSLTVELEPGSARGYQFNGAGASFYYGTTGTVATDSAMGLYDGDRKLLDDWILVVDGVPRDRAEATVTVKPHEVMFLWPDRVRLIVAPVSVEKDDLRFTALFDEEPSGADSTETEQRHRVGIYFVFPEHLNIQKAYPIKTRGVQHYLSTSDGDSLFMAVGSLKWFVAPEIRPKANHPQGPYSAHVGKEIHGAMFDGNGFDLVFTWDVSARAARDRLSQMQRTDFISQRDRKQWLLDELNRSYFRCDDERVNKAVSWAKLSQPSLLGEDERALLARYQNCLGITPLKGESGVFSFDPQIPTEWGNVEAIIQLEGRSGYYKTMIQDDSVEISFELLVADSSIEGQLTLKAFERTRDFADNTGMLTRVLSAERPETTFSFRRVGNLVEVDIPEGMMLPAFQTFQIPLFISADDDETFPQPRPEDEQKSSQTEKKE
ncbi:MAG TPA: hypothetical protein ENH10_07685 [Bacteroidetes bacterium]|nr:hypothetical protein BMS3Bbin04_01299 [bacterium BMS3Bbin04]HDO65893.1 hypothetical protein [Bacteroidota bacterium]HEX05018.1 hypothetical protein [Bacteroidota bacterium]